MRRSLHDTLSDMGLEPAGIRGDLDRYIGYLAPYATSHEALDQDGAVVQEVRNAMKVLVGKVSELRARKAPRPDDELRDPRPK